MAVCITIPEELEDCPPEIKNTKAYVERYGVGHSCAKAVCDFYLLGQKNFKAYIALKAGGMDKYSRKSAEMIAADLKKDSELYVQTLRDYFEDDKDVNAAARWNARGLTVEDSIRKVLVDAEVRQNITNRHF